MAKKLVLRTTFNTKARASTEVAHLTHSSKIAGLNPTTGTGTEKIARKNWYFELVLIQWLELAQQ